MARRATRSQIIVVQRSWGIFYSMHPSITSMFYTSIACVSPHSAVVLTNRVLPLPVLAVVLRVPDTRAGTAVAVSALSAAEDFGSEIWHGPTLAA